MNISYLKNRFDERGYDLKINDKQQIEIMYRLHDNIYEKEESMICDNDGVFYYDRGLHKLSSFDTIEKNLLAAFLFKLYIGNDEFKKNRDNIWNAKDQNDIEKVFKNTFNNNFLSEKLNTNSNDSFIFSKENDNYRVLYKCDENLFYKICKGRNLNSVYAFLYDSLYDYSELENVLYNANVDDLSAVDKMRMFSIYHSKKDCTVVGLIEKQNNW